jgi:hypothetical protein
MHGAGNIKFILLFQAQLYSKFLIISEGLGKVFSSNIHTNMLRYKHTHRIKQLMLFRILYLQGLSLLLLLLLLLSS